MNSDPEQLEKSPVQKTEAEANPEEETQANPEEETQAQIPFRVASKGKRVFAFILDFVFILLVMNTLEQFGRAEHWDLISSSYTSADLIQFYGSIALYLLFRDVLLGGRSLGKLILGMKICLISDLSQKASTQKMLQRNLTLLIFPVDLYYLLRDSYARRLGDQWSETVVLDNPKALRWVMRLLVANTLLFGFFMLAILLQEKTIQKTSIYQTAYSAIQADPSFEKAFEDERILENPEMSLDLREKAGPSLIRFTLNTQPKQQINVTLQLTLTEPKRWEVLEIKTEGMTD